MSPRPRPFALTVVALVATGSMASGLAGSAAASVPQASTTAAAAAGTYFPTTPTRVLDTRLGKGAAKAKVGDGRTINVKVVGVSPVPNVAVRAVVLNLTGVYPSTGSFLTVYPKGQTRPTVSSLNLTHGITRANLVTAPVSADGYVTIYNNDGAVDVLADVVGYYAGDDAGGSGLSYQPFNSYRVIDTRAAQEKAFRPYESGVYTFEDAPLDLTALALNVTITRGSGNGFVSVWNGQGKPPTTSSVNYRSNESIPNMVITKVGKTSAAPTDFTLGIYNGSAGYVHVIVDIVGHYSSTPGNGLVFEPITPTRIVDTRINQGIHGAIGTTATSASTSVVADAATTDTLVGNLTAIRPSANTHYTIWRDYSGVTEPATSVLNAAAGQVVANAVMIPVGDIPDGRFMVRTAAGTSHIAVDVTGRFTLPAVATQAQQRASGSVTSAAAEQVTPAAVR